MPDKPLLLDFVLGHGRRRRNTLWIGWLLEDREATAHLLMSAAVLLQRKLETLTPSLEVQAK